MQFFKKQVQRNQKLTPRETTILLIVSQSAYKIEQTALFYEHMYDKSSAYALNIEHML